MIALHVLNSPVDSFFIIYLSLPFNLNSQKRMFVKYVSYGKSSNLIDRFLNTFTEIFGVWRRGLVQSILSIETKSHSVPKD